MHKVRELKVYKLSGSVDVTLKLFLRPLAHQLRSFSLNISISSEKRADLQEGAGAKREF